MQSISVEKKGPRKLYMIPEIIHEEAEGEHEADKGGNDLNASREQRGSKSGGRVDSGGP
jgi:hypothetical protein